MPSNHPPLVGVTGGIGSGKTEVCRVFADLGRRIISADEVARDLTENDPAVRREIQARFGDGIYGREGLRRRELAEVIFASPAKRNQLDRIVHPRVFSSVKSLAAKHATDGIQPYVIVEAALVFESGMDEMLDATVLVRASDAARRSRLAARDHLRPEEIEQRFNSQNTQEKNAGKADYIIDNDGPVASLLEKVRFIDMLLRTTLGRR